MPDRAASAISYTYSQLRGYAMRVFLISLFGWSLSNMDQSLFGYVIPSIMSDFHIGLDTVGWILSVSFVFSAISVLMIGLLTDQFGRRIMFVSCLGISAFLVGLHAWASSLAVLVVLRTLAFGISGGLAPITNTFTVEAAPARLRGLATGLLQCGYPIGWFAASLLAAPLIKAYGWRSVFLPALAVVPIAFLLFRYLPESELFKQIKHDRKAAPDQSEDIPKSSSTLARVTELFKPDLLRKTILSFLAFFLFGGAYAGTAFYFPKFFSEVRGYSQEEAVSIVGTSYGIGVIGYIAASFVGEFYLTRRTTIVIWVWTGAVALVGVVWLAGSYWSNICWFGLMTMFFYGTSAVITTFLTEIFPTRIRATGAAFSGSLAVNLGFATFPILAAKAVEILGWQWAFTLVAVPPLIICGLAILGLENIASGREVDDIGI
jgi:MFS family permease